MASAIVRKSWTDLTRRRARSVLTILSLSLAVASFGILALPTLMDRAMREQVAAARLYDLYVPVHDVQLSRAQLHEMGQLANVAAVQARTVYTTRTLIGTRRVATEVWGVPSFSSQPVDRVIAPTIPAKNEVLVDVRDAMSAISNASAGDTLRVQAANGSYRALRVAGSANSLAFNQDALTGTLVLYATQATVLQLSGANGVNLIEIRLHHSSPSAAASTLSELRKFLAAQPQPTWFTNMPTARPAGQWPLESIFNSRVKVLDILIVLALLSALFLLGNTIRTLVAEQSREVGVMRSIGASARDVRNAFLRTAALMAMFGSALGAVFGVGLAYLFLRLFAHAIYGVTPGFGVDWPVVAIGAVAGIVGTVFVALPTLHRVLRIPVHDALSSEGLVSEFGERRLDRAVTRASVLPSALRIGIRGVVRERQRSLATILQVSLAVATLLGLMSLGVAASDVTNQSWNVLDYDATLSVQPGGALYGPAVVREIRAQPGVAGVEAADWYKVSYRGTTLYALGVHAHTFVHEPLAAGRWLSVAEEHSAARVAVIGSAVARKWNLQPGSIVRISTASGPTTFKVIGVGASLANNGDNLYTSLPALQVLTHEPGMANSLFIRAADKRHAAIDRLTWRLEGLLARAGYPSTSQVMYAGRATDQASSSSMLVIVQGLGLLIVAISMLGLANAITMSIIERTREIGVMRAIGARARDVRRIFRTETTALALLGFVLAIPLGLLIAHALQALVLHFTGESLPVPYTLRDLFIAFLGTIALAMLVVVAPLRRATRLRPGSAIRYD